MTFGEKIRSARISKNLTQKQLADLIGAKHNSISDWEKNKSKPDVDTIELICGVLDLTPSYLVGKKSDSEYGNIVGTLMNDHDLLDMIADFQDLSFDDKKLIRQLISSLSKKSRG